MGDKSPKSKQKNQSQKQTKTNSENRQKQKIIDSKKSAAIPSAGKKK